MRRSLTVIITLGLVTGLVACGDSGDEIAELRTEIPDLEVKDEDKESPIDSGTSLGNETVERKGENEQEIENEQETKEWFSGRYLPRHCPEIASEDEYITPSKSEILECEPDHMLEVRLDAEVVRSENSSEDVYGIQQYLRIFQMMEHVPTTGQFGLWGQWIGDDRARPHGPFNSIEGGLFIHDKMGRSKFPKYGASAATHLYSPLSDTGGGWGFYEARIDCTVLGRVTLSNNLIVPPNLISFDEDQETYDDEGGIFLGTSWVGLPIFGGAERVDEEPWDINSGKLTWTFFLDAANFSGPAIAYVPEHWSRRVDRWNSLEFLDDIYDWDWDESPAATAMFEFIEGTVTKEELYNVIGDESWFTAQPDDPNWEDNPYWVKAEQTLGYSPARPYLPIGSEMPPIPVFSETDENGRVFLKIFPPLFPKEQEVEPFVLNVKTFDVNLYNHFLDTFMLDGDFGNSQTSFGEFGIPMQIQGWGEEPWHEIQIQPKEYEDDPEFIINTPLRPRESNGEVNIYFEWEETDESERGWGQYYEIQGTNVTPANPDDVPPSLTQLEYGTIPYTTSLQPHVLAENGIEKEYIEDQSDNSYWSYTPDYSCFGCENVEACDEEIQQSVLDDGSIISYRWYRFKDQPVFQSLIKDYPEIYTNEYLMELQNLIERMHAEWGNSQLFLERPSTIEKIHLAEIDHGLLVEPPEGKEVGWVPIVTQVDQPDGTPADFNNLRETPFGSLNSY